MLFREHDEDYYGGDAYSEEPTYTHEPPRYKRDEMGVREEQSMLGRRGKIALAVALPVSLGIGIPKLKKIKKVAKNHVLKKVAKFHKEVVRHEVHKMMNTTTKPPPRPCPADCEPDCPPDCVPVPLPL